MATAVERARELLDLFGRGGVHKTIWGSPAGKKRLAERLVALLPAHKTYVEPFAGSAAVLFAKEPAETEVINDADQEIVQAYRIIKRITQKQLERLRRLSWTGDEATFKRLIDASPSDDVGWLHRFLYLTHFSYGKMRGKSFSPSTQGIEARTVERVESFAPRLKQVHIHSGDYEKVVRKYDGPDTAFFLDPPYPGYNVNVGESDFDEERFLGVLEALKGRFLMTYGVRGKLPALLAKAGYHIKRIRTPRSIGSMRGVGGPSVLTQLLVSNYKLTEKAAGGPALEDWEGQLELDDLLGDPPVAVAVKAGKSADGFAKAIPLIKGIDPADERYVLGIVLEPEVVDAQGDIYSAAEVRQAAHRFMEEFGGLGLMHRLRVNDQVKVLESYLAPADLSLGESSVRKGTWLLAVRILADELWEQVKDGQLTGFSIGGSARSVPEGEAPGAPEDDQRRAA
jgi:DNA adenine methylase